MDFTLQVNLIFKKLPRSLAVLGLLVAGCSHHHAVHREYYVPEKGGILRFDGSFSDFKNVKNTERIAALKLAQNFCHGPIKVIKEGSEFVEAPATRESSTPSDVLDPDVDEAQKPQDAAEPSSPETANVIAAPSPSMSVQGQADTGEVFVQFRCALQGKK